MLLLLSTQFPVPLMSFQIEFLLFEQENTIFSRLFAETGKNRASFVSRQMLLSIATQFVAVGYIERGQS